MPRPLIMEFCPGIYEHAAALIGRRPWEVSRSRDLLVEAHAGAWRRYGQRLVVVGVDVYNIEPEAHGALVTEPAGNNVPAIARHPFEELEDLTDLPDFDTGAGRIPEILGAAADLVTTCAGAEVRVPVCGPMAFAGGLLGMENLLVGLLEDPETAEAAMANLVSHQTEYLRAIREAGARPVFFESGATPPLLPVTMFQDIEAPALGSLFDVAEAVFGERPPCIIGGEAAPIAPAFLEAGPGYVIAPSETDRAAFLAAAGPHPQIHVRVNMPATLLAGGAAWPEIESGALLAMNLAAERPNTSVGCGVVPFETDPALLLRLRDFIQTPPATIHTP
jgi:uroporphyrinogen decarboxylase